MYLHLALGMFMSSTNHPPLIKDLLHLREEGKRLINGPHAYRSKDFTRWHKQALVLYQSVTRFDVGDEVEKEFQQRRFGKTLSLLNENEIRNLFKQDMNITIQQLDALLANYETMGELKPPSLSLRWKLFWADENKGSRRGVISVVLSVLILLIVLIIWVLL